MLHRRTHWPVGVEIAYRAEQGALSRILAHVTTAGWSVTAFTRLERAELDTAASRLELVGGADVGALFGPIAALPGAVALTPAPADDLEERCARYRVGPRPSMPVAG